MSYNWQKIFENKSDEELYEIFVGKRNLTQEAQEFAKKELAARDFNFTNLEKYQKKWKLKKLIDEERSEAGTYSLFRFTLNSKRYLLMTIFGAIMSLLMTLDYFFGFMTKTTENTNSVEQIGFIVFFFLFFIVGMFLYKNKKLQERNRKSEINELLKKI